MEYLHGGLQAETQADLEAEAGKDTRVGKRQGNCSVPRQLKILSNQEAANPAVETETRKQPAEETKQPTLQ
jgi:hypothetical protein